MFKAGDAIVHPVRGVGMVECIEKRQWRGSSDLYYKIKLLSEQTTSLMVPVSAAETLGLRRAIKPSKLKHVWRVLRADPRMLPTNHKRRYELLKDKLHGGDILQVAEVVRDTAWRQEQEGRLTTVGKRLYDKGIVLLAGEIAAAQGIDLAAAEVQIRERLKESISPTAAM
jgi:RNA polymerase-interacting CarD/CdnL/TRCF family regulator